MANKFSYTLWHWAYGGMLQDLSHRTSAEKGGVNEEGKFAGVSAQCIQVGEGFNKTEIIVDIIRQWIVPQAHSGVGSGGGRAEVSAITLCARNCRACALNSTHDAFPAASANAEKFPNEKLTWPGPF